MTPLKWLHMTTLIAGSTADISGDHLEQMVTAASQLLSGTGLIKVTVGELLYHPEAIMLGVRPKESLMPVFDAVRTATRTVTGKDGLTGNGQRWTPPHHRVLQHVFATRATNHHRPWARNAKLPSHHRQCQPGHPARG